MKVAIIGKGRVGTSLGSSLAKAGHDVRYGHRDPKEPVKEAANWGDVIVLAVPFGSLKDLSKEISALSEGKVVIDVTNALGDNEKFVGCVTSAAEQLQEAIPGSKVVKAFNYVFASHQKTGRIGNEVLTAFVAGDDGDARKTVMKLAADIGFESVDCGPLKSARYLEGMARLLIDLSMVQRLGADIGYRLVRK